MGTSPQRALLNDINPHLINFYKQVRRGLVISIPLVNDRKTFYLYRNRFNALIRRNQALSKQGAEIFYYLNKTGYNGLCRFNKDGLYNVPFGQHKKITYLRTFTEYKHVLSRWSFTTLPFTEVPKTHSDLIYADPPYDVEFTQYSKEGFDWDDQVRLADLLARHNGPVLLSNQATSRIIKLYKFMGFELHFLDAPRRISCNGDRTPAQEVLALKNT